LVNANEVLWNLRKNKAIDQGCLDFRSIDKISLTHGSTLSATCVSQFSGTYQCNEITWGAEEPCGLLTVTVADWSASIRLA
jgi:hypothetical protein